jgi:hypothetical protein
MRQCAELGTLSDVHAKEILMSDTNQSGTSVAEANDELSRREENSTVSSEPNADDEQSSLGSKIPRPATSLDSPPKGEIGKFTVMLLSDISSAPVLEEIEQVNKHASSQARTPLMTVVLAIIAKNGGTMVVEDLASQVAEYWNRSFPTSPFTREEFVYVLVRSADNLRVREQS